MPGPDELNLTNPNPPETTPNTGGNSGTFSQEQVNAILSDRLKRAEESTTKKLLESLGVESVDAIKAIVEAKKKADDDVKTESQKLADQLAAIKAQYDKDKAEHAATVEALNTRLLNSEIKQAASRPVVDKDGKVTRAAFRAEALGDVLVLLDRSGIKSEEGKWTGVEEALAALAKSKTYLVAESKAQPAFKGSPQPPAQGKTQEGQTQAPRKPRFSL